MQVEPEGIEDGGFRGSYHSFCFSVEDKGMTGGGFIAHANRNSRGGGWWKNSGIGVGLIHHGDWRCLRTSAVGFVLGMYHWSGREVTKSLWQNYLHPKIQVQLHTNWDLHTITTLLQHPYNSHPLASLCSHNTLLLQTSALTLPTCMPITLFKEP